MFKSSRKSSVNPSWIFLELFVSCFYFANAQEYSRGIGIYPGNPEEDFSPIFENADTCYRNLAFLRTTYNSSSYDYNLTAQLVTDGIIDTLLPSWIVVSTGQKGILPRNERQRIFDRHRMTNISLNGSDGWIQFLLNGNSDPITADSITISGSLLTGNEPSEKWEIRLLGSNNQDVWEEISIVNGNGHPGDSLPVQWRRWAPSNMRIFIYPLIPGSVKGYKNFKAEFSAPGATQWNITEIEMFSLKKKINIGGPYSFTSAWMSAGNGKEWVTVDLGTGCSFNEIILYWIRRAISGNIQVSDNGSVWSDVATIPTSSGKVDSVKFREPVTKRYIRVFMDQAASKEGYILSEIKVMGRGGERAIPKSNIYKLTDNKLNLDGGEWRLQRANLVNATGEMLSNSEYNDKKWVLATVPATILVSYLNVGALPDPNFGDNQLMISDSYFWSDFWYRRKFIVPESFDAKKIFLNFDGINWKAEVFLNGKKLGDISGAFMRGKFDITEYVVNGKENVIAVKIIKNEAPGYAKEHTEYSPDANGGELGGDNPAFHASVGWDWIPTIRGRNTGIWNDVYLTSTGPVTLENPFISSDLPLPDTLYADLNVEVTLHNSLLKKVKGTLQVKIGGVLIEKIIELQPVSSQLVKLNSSVNKELRLNYPELWWPNGYGRQILYDVDFKFITAEGKVSDEKSFKTGIREMSYSEDGGILKIWVNGRRFIGRGGNWGFSESMLRYRGREYETAVKYHKDMNFTMIRNWVGQTGDDEFFDACDRNGIMVWEDFWLANPVDGPDPYDNQLFMHNAKDFILRIRNHPSIGIYVGRNEGYPPEAIDNGLRKLLPELHPGLHYIPNSAWDVVSGGGPYRAIPVKSYFQDRATPKFHSEMGRPAIVNYESLREMIPDTARWPSGQMWGLHDFCLDGAQRASSFIKQMEESFGEISSETEWIKLAQVMNYDGYRAMFEAQSKNRMGLLLWMSHPAWPSMVWQTYDYYFDPTAAYFGCKKACEPLHIQWNALTDSIEVVNYSETNGNKLTASLEILNVDGSIKYENKIGINAPIDSRNLCFKMLCPEDLSDIYFIRLKLTRENQIISENLYLRGKEEGNLKEIRKLSPVKLTNSIVKKREGNKWYITSTLFNSQKVPAIMTRLKVIGENSHERILPAIFSDNYITLMPGESKTIRIEIEDADTRGEKPVVVLDGLNVQ
jgi:hypothetical protein